MKIKKFFESKENLYQELYDIRYSTAYGVDKIEIMKSSDDARIMSILPFSKKEIQVIKCILHNVCSKIEHNTSDGDSTIEHMHMDHVDSGDHFDIMKLEDDYFLVENLDSEVFHLCDTIDGLKLCLVGEYGAKMFDEKSKEYLILSIKSNIEEIDKLPKESLEKINRLLNHEN